ncbi:ATP-dependent DNA helicase [Vibrio harveyi]|uniref:ATP-dependent DNA helicase n=1 Tax=Vibrio harveyi TaxID=669 RepID=UPI003CEB2BB3
MELIKARLVKYINYQEGKNFVVATMKAIDSKGAKAVKDATGDENGYFTIKGRSFFKPGSEDMVYVSGEWRQSTMNLSTCLPSSLIDNGKPDLFEMLNTDFFTSLEGPEIVRMRAKYGTSTDLAKALLTDMDSALKGVEFNDKKINSFKEEWSFAYRNARGFGALRQLGLEPNHASEVITGLGPQTDDVSVLKYLAKNPYELGGENGFSIVDEFCKKQPYSFDETLRLSCMITGYFAEMRSMGSTCCEITDFANMANVRFGVDPYALKNTIKVLGSTGAIDMQTINDREFIVDRKYNSVEKEAAELFARYLATPWKQKDTSHIKPKEDFLNEEQLEAVDKSLNSKFMVISGGPGTGKTTVTKSVLDCIRRGYGDDIKILCAAPTGRAASRMAESTGEDVSTVHSMLKYNHKVGFDAEGGRYVDADVIVVDEASMLDVELFRNLMLSIKPDSRLILVGDVDQLDSVESGNVLEDLIESGGVSKTYLKINNRSKGKIVENANMVKVGQIPELSQNRYGDFHFIETQDDSEVVSKTVSLCQKFLPGELGLGLDEIQVLSPQFETKVGVHNFNKALRDIFNPGGQGKFQSDVFGKLFRVDDRVIANKSDSKLKLINGSIGKVKFIDWKTRVVAVDFGYETISVPFNKTKSIDLAYSKTIHKSQGSEYGAVIIPLSMSNARMLNRKLLYTAITRAKKHVFLIGDKAALAEALKEERQIHRTSVFREYLKHLLDVSQSKTLLHEQAPLKAMGY